jgi:hypothetical protein
VSGGSATVETRTSSDGSTWSAWAAVGGSGGAIPSPDSRYLQYRISLATSTTSTSPEVRQVSVSYNSLAPIAVPGGPYTGDEGTSITLDGTGSTDPDNQIVAYAWDFDYDGFFDLEATGITATMALTDGPKVRHVALRATDQTGYSEVRRTSVTVNNVDPTAEAGAERVVNEGQWFTLNGTGTDVPADDLAYQWDWSYDGSFFINAVGTSVATSYTDGPATYVVGLRVIDDDGGRTTDTLTVTVQNVSPTVRLDDRTVYEGSPVVLQAQVTDPGQDTFTYAWDLGDGTTSTEVTPTNSYPEGIYTVAVTVYDDDGGGPASDSATLTVINAPPAADAGPNQTVGEGQVVNLSGSGSDASGDTLTYAWDFDYDGGTFDTDATGQNASTSYPDGPDAYVVALRVSDQDGGQTIDTLNVTVTNVDPAIDAGGSYQAQAGEMIVFTVDIDDVAADTHVVEWDLNDDGIYETGGLTATRAYAVEGSYQVRVRVTDDDGGSTTEVVMVFIGDFRIFLPMVDRR